MKSTTPKSTSGTSELDKNSTPAIFDGRIFII